MRILLAATLSLAVALPMSAPAAQAPVACGEDYSVVRGDTLSGISLRSYGSYLYQPIYSANIDTIGTNPDVIHIDQSLYIPCLSADGTAMMPADDTIIEGQLTFTFNKASAPPFVINSGIIDEYLAEITEVTEGRVTFVDPEVVNRDHSQQLDLVTSGAVDGAYVLNTHLAASHPLLQLPMQPTFGGSAEQVAVSLWKLHERYLSQANYFPEAQLLGFVSAPAAHIWRDGNAPISLGENITDANDYHVPYFHGLDTRGPAVMRAEAAQLIADFPEYDTPTFFLAHGAAIALGIWSEDSSVTVMEVDNGVYTPTFSVVLSNEAWAQITPQDQQAIMKVSGEALAHRSAAWDAFDNSFRSRMLERGLKFEKASKALFDELFLSSMTGMKSWMTAANNNGIPANEAVNFYLESLRQYEDRLIYRAEESALDDHPFVTGY